MYERVSAEPEGYAMFRALTEPVAGPTMTPKADSQHSEKPAIKE
jgi:hypothetical protein